MPLAIDLYCGLGGWTEGLLMEGYHVVGFDIERHAYGEARYPAQLVLQDVLTIHGSQFKDAALIVASPPCQAYSYRAMPWKRAKALPPPDNSLFEACFRIQREAEEAAGGPIPLVVENVCGAQKWVGRARWHYGSFYLWGDVPALMPIVRARPAVQVHRSGVVSNRISRGGVREAPPVRRKREVEKDLARGGNRDYAEVSSPPHRNEGDSSAMSKKQQAARQRPEDAGSCYEGCCGCGLIYYETQPAGGEVTPLGLAPLVLRYELRQYPNTPPMDAMLVGLIEETETGLRWISVATIADILARLAAPAPASREEP